MSTLENPDHVCDQAYAAYQAGDTRLAQRLTSAVLEHASRHARALYLQGVLLQDDGQLDAAVASTQRALDVDPSNGVYANALGEMLRAQGQSERARSHFERATQVQPGYARAWSNLGQANLQRDRIDDAVACLEEAVRLNPGYVIAWNTLGAALQHKQQHEAAIAAFQRAIALAPDYPEALHNLGTSLIAMGRPSEAVAALERAIAHRPTYDKALFRLGELLRSLRQDYRALTLFQRAVELQPENAGYARTLGSHLLVKRDWEAALPLLETAHRLDPADPANLSQLFHARQLTCDWNDYPVMVDALWTACDDAVRSGQPAPVGPFQSLTLPWSCAQLRRVAHSHSAAWCRLQAEPVRSTRDGQRQRIGYLSGDLHDHAVGHLLHGFFEKHDRERFDVFVYAFSPADGSRYRTRIEAGVEHFVDVSSLDPLQMAERMRSDGIQILVDLMGYTGAYRVQALARRAAPLQVSFMGMLGTMGADFIDYLVADPHIISPQMAPHFDEKLIRMPHSYLIAEPITPGPATPRAMHHLPEDAFVFCCFNSTYKIEPFTFDGWMRILEAVPHSVLWLNAAGPCVEENLRRNACARGVDPQRLIFTPFAACEAHIERQRHADLFLDTFVYNAAATASMALQAGLPVLTLQGETFASRVGRSLLEAVGLSEMVTCSSQDYVQRAIALARDARGLAAVRERLRAALPSSPLFDAARFVRNLERAYAAIWQRHLQGEAPRDIVVEE